MTGFAETIDFAVRKTALAVVVAGFVAGSAGVISARDTDPAVVQGALPTNTTKDKNVAAGESEAKRLLLLMDRDQSGKVSRQEFMDFMAAEFDRLDKNKDGALDVQELTRTNLTAPPRGAVHR